MAKKEPKKEALVSGLGETLGELATKKEGAEKALLGRIKVTRGTVEEVLEAALQYGQVARRHRRLARKTRQSQEE